MNITGRITADATVRSIAGSKSVVNFTVAVNKYYVTNGERKKETRFFECAYWRSDSVASYLRKGILVEVYGEIGARAYLNKTNQPVAVLTLRVDRIVLHEWNKESHSIAAEDMGAVGEDGLLHFEELPVRE
ncbi:single-stranded DNA-binding protein [Pedobacter sp. GR22-6]|uniref:single-stranded DNA-binding protein n=1 Tax=Pedobacter sp. GR22-6 TaxID=3127957 RepID=UPI00307E5A80